MRFTAECGLKPDETWNLTIHELWLYCEGAKRRDRELAYNTAALSRQQKLPNIKKWLGLKSVKLDKTEFEKMKQDDMELRKIFPD